MRRRLIATLLVAAGLLAPALATSTSPLPGTLRIEPLPLSAFPYDGAIPEQDKPFLEGPPGARYHLAPRGGKLMADKTYSDTRSLLYMPPSFDPAAPDAAIIVFFHGNLATLRRDVDVRQGVPRQLFQSGMNAALVAPQLAVDALESSPGHFYEPGFFTSYLGAAEDRFAALSNGRATKQALQRLPVIIVAYSGGYLATAFTLQYEPPEGRIRGVVFLDALFGEADKIERWIVAQHDHAFFVSAFSKAATPLNTALESSLRAKGVTIETDLPTSVKPGDVIFKAALNAVHDDFVTRAWTPDPLRVLLACIQLDDGAPRRSCGAARGRTAGSRPSTSE